MTVVHDYNPSLSWEGDFQWDFAGLYQLTCPDSTIALEGATKTTALPVGPALVQVATVTQGGTPVPGRAVTITVAGGRSATGATDGAGKFYFTYLPPDHSATAEIRATCERCFNTATNTIKVEDIPPPETCEAGDAVGNPVSPSTGEKLQTETDWADLGAHPLRFVRHYRSYGNLNSSLSERWSHPYVASIAGGSSPRVVQLGDGSKAIFSRASEAAPWVANNGKDSLVEVAGGWLYTRASDESRWMIEASNRLASITQRNGWVTTLGYNATGQLSSIRNAFGRSLLLAYDASGRLGSITAPDGKLITYAYDGIARLSRVTYPDGTGKSYLYEDARWPLALTGIDDEHGRRFATFSYDAAGRAVSTAHAGGVQNYSLTYLGSPSAGTPSGSVVEGSTVDATVYQTTAHVIDPSGTIQTWRYQGGDGSVRVLGAFGAFEGGQVASRSFTPGANLPAIETDFEGTQTTFAWDMSRRLLLSTTKAANYPEAKTTHTQWHPTLRLPVLVTEPGRTSAYTYDTLGNKLSETVTDSVTGQARTWQWTYLANGLNDSVTEPQGGVWRFEYDSAGNRTSVKNPLGQETRFGFDAGGRVLNQTDPNGLVTSYSYDARGRMVQVTLGAEVTTFAYTPSGQINGVTLPNGYAAAYSYDAAQRLVGVSDNRGNSISYTLDGMGNRVREEVKDGSGTLALVVARTMNYLNLVAEISGAVGRTVQYEFDNNGELRRQYDPLNQSIGRVLDPLRRPVSTGFPDGNTANLAWNGLDQLTSATDPKGVQTQYSRNAWGEVLAETSPDIGTLSYQRDANGLVTASTDAKGQTTRITRDALGRPSVITLADGKTQQLVYDTAGNISQITDPSGGTDYSRDSLGRVLQKTQTVNDNPSHPGNYRVQYDYDPGGAVAQITYPSGLKVYYRKNATGLVNQIDVQTPAAGALVMPFVTALSYTALGQPKSWAWSNGDSASRVFDADARMTQNEFAAYGFDAASRITNITQQLWADPVSSGGIDPGPTPIDPIDPDPLALSRPGSSLARSGAPRPGVRALGAAASTSSPAGPLRQAVTWRIDYDNRNRITDLQRSAPGTITANTRYSYDANSNRLTSIDTATTDNDFDGEFLATNLGRSTSQTLNLDAASNRLLGLSQTLTATKGTSTVSTVGASVTYGLDANGNLSSDGLRSFEHDGANRLSGVRVGLDREAVKVSYLHNALGQRVFKSETTLMETVPSEAELGAPFIAWLKANFGWLFTPSTSTAMLGQSFVYDEQGSLLAEYGNGGTQHGGQAEYIWLPTESGPSMLVGVLKGGQLHAVHTDHLGTPRLITNSSNKPVWQWPYSGFGNNLPSGVLMRVPANTGGPTPPPPPDPEPLPTFAGIGGATNTGLRRTEPLLGFNLRFPGQYFDAESGLNYNYFRSYQASQGRYTQPDPIGLDGGWNQYSFVGGDPLTGIDQLGLETCVVVTTNSLGVRDHAALYISRGGYRGQPFLFDPSGSYAQSNGGGTGDFVEGKAANLDKFAKYHKDSKVEKTCKDTDVAEEKRLADKIVAMPSPGVAQCAANVSTALFGSKYFPKVDAGTIFPGNLYRDAAKNK